MEKILDDVCVRADSYKFLSDCYYLPDNNFLERFKDAAQINILFAELASLIPPAVDIETLKVDFTRLFVGPFKLLASPYGSVYLENNTIMGESTVDVRKFYENEDLGIVIKDVPDHIAMELEFMYYLVAKQTQATNEENLKDIQLYQQKQKSFLSVHLARWLPKFAEKVQNNSQTEFYKKLARLTEIFVQKDLDAQESYSIGGG